MSVLFERDKKRDSAFIAGWQFLNKKISPNCAIRAMQMVISTVKEESKFKTRQRESEEKFLEG